MTCGPTTLNGPRPAFLRVIGVALALFGMLAHGALSAQGDSLTIRDKVLINIAAELQAGSYANILNTFSRYDAASAGDMADVQQYIAALTAGDDRIFMDSTALIEDNINPAMKAGMDVPDLAAPVYLNDFFTFFHRDAHGEKEEGSAPITMERADYGEPHAVQGNTVVTSLLYNVHWHGTHRTTGARYTPHQRLIVFQAEHKGSDWTAHIVSDSWYSPAITPFRSFEKELLAEQARSKGQKTTLLQEYRAAEAQALEEARHIREQRTTAYGNYIALGDQKLNDDPEGAVFWYGKAGELAPAGRWDHVIGQSRARRALDDRARIQQDQKLKDMALDLARQLDARKYRSVALPGFTEEDGRPSALGKSLAEKLAIHLSQAAASFDLADQSMVDRNLEQRRGMGAIDEKDQIAVGKTIGAQAVITGKLVRIGEDRVELATRILDIRKQSVAGGSPGQVLPLLPQERGAPMAQEPAPAGTQPGPTTAKPTMTRGHTAIGITGGVNLARLMGTDSLTERFTQGGTGFRIGLELERMSPKGNSRFATGLRLARYASSTGDDGLLARKITVNYLQLPLLYRLFTNRTAAGRFGLQLGAIGGYYFFGRTESYTPNLYVEVSPFNLHGSAGLCYEKAVGKVLRIVANASYDPMLFGLGDADKEPLTPSTDGPRFSAFSFAVGATFLLSPTSRHDDNSL